MPIDPLLKTRLQRVVRRQRQLQLWCKLAATWSGVALLGLILLALQRQAGWASSLVLPLVILLGLAAAGIIVARNGRVQPDWHELALRIERRHPVLDGLLLTAVQQQPGPDGKLGFLQERLVGEALRHSQQSDWAEAVPKFRLILAQTLHWVAVVLLVVVGSRLRVTGGHSLLAKLAESGITVTPGDTTLERGSSLVVLARFHGALPVNVELVVSDSPEASRRITLVKSLSDPMFGGSVSEVASNLVYHVEYAGQRTRDFKVAVFEYPRLDRADADLTFPDYTAQPPKHIENTRRLSAVEGSRLDLTLRLNKPVVSASLVSKDKERSAIPLLVETNRPVVALKQFPFAASKTYELQLLDSDGRTNKVPAQFVFETSTNRLPELRLAAPRGDLKPSPLEEISFEGTVWDDFGIPAYGMGYTVAGQETKIIQLGQTVPAREKRPFKHLLRLEELGAEPDELISWFIWADDIGPDGRVRRTTSDLFFGEVRPFDEIFREGQAMDGESQGESGAQQGGRNSKLTEMQKQIAIATWKLQRERPSTLREHASTNSHTFIRTEHRATFASWSIPKAECRRPKEGRSPNSEPLRNWGDFGLRPSGFGLLSAFGPRSSEFHALLAQDSADDSISSPTPARKSASLPANPGSQPLDPLAVILESQAQALALAEAALQRQRDPQTAPLWSAAVKNMEQALAHLNAATNSPAALADALAAEQAAYQSLMRLQQHEFQVMRNRNRNQRGNGGDQQTERQLDEMELTKSENRYETQRQAEAPQTAPRREQLQVMNRLQELARRQQDLDDRLKELQTALQEARTEEERAEIQRRLKRLQEEEHQVLADTDELRQRMDRPENQSRMAEERRQLDQTREDVQRAAEAAGQGAVSQALASGTRAQRQLQQMRDQLRKENSSQFADDLREMRAQARELARQQEDLVTKMNTEAGSDRKSLSDSPERRGMQEQLARQREQLTNLVERATQMSQQAEEAEPLLSRQLYDTVRKFTQDSSKQVKEIQDQLLSRGLLTRNLLDQLKDPSEPDAAKLQDLTAELLRQDFLPQAAQTGQRAGTGIENLKRGMERAAESVLGDDGEALRLAQQELDQLTAQLQHEMSQTEGGPSQTNQPPAVAEHARTDQQSTNRTAGAGRRQPGEPEQRSAQVAQARGQNPHSPEQAGSNQEGAQAQSPGEQTASASGDQQPEPSPSPNGETPGEQSGSNTGEGQTRQRQTTQAARAGRTSGDATQRDGATDGGPYNAGAGGGGYAANNYRRDLDTLLNDSGRRQLGPLTGDDFLSWSERLRNLEEMLDQPALRNEVAAARERARVLRQEFKHDRKKPDWAVVRLQIMKPLTEVRDRIADELARRESREALVPIDRDPVPNRYSDLVRRYYEELGKDK